MSTSYIFLLGMITIWFGFIFFKFHWNRNRKINPKRDNEEINLNSNYIYKPDIKLLLLEIIPIFVFAIIYIPFFSSDPDYSLLTNMFIAIISGLFVSSIMVVLFLINNSRKIVFKYKQIEIYSFFPIAPKIVKWDNIERIEYLIQNDKVWFEEKKPLIKYSKAGLMHFKTKDKMEIQALLDANLIRLDKQLEINYW